MKIEQLRWLIEIVNCGSINQAAQKLFIAHSSLSFAVKSLEAEFGEAIFERNNKGMALTYFGADVYNQAKMICAEIDFLQTISEKKKEQPVENLSISNMFSSLANETFIELYKENSVSQKLKLSIQECSILTIMEHVQTGISEIGIVTLFSNSAAMYSRLLENKGLEYHKLSDKQLFIVVGPNNPIYEREIEGITLDELQDYPFAIYYGENFETSFKNFFTNIKRNKPNISVSNIDFLSDLLLETDAFTIETYYEKEYQKSQYFKGLRLVPLKNVDYTCEFGWIKLKDSQLSSLASVYVEKLREKVTLQDKTRITK